MLLHNPRYHSLQLLAAHLPSRELQRLLDIPTEHWIPYSWSGKPARCLLGHLLGDETTDGWYQPNPLRAYLPQASAAPFMLAFDWCCHQFGTPIVVAQLQRTFRAVLTLRRKGELDEPRPIAAVPKPCRVTDRQVSEYAKCYFAPEPKLERWTNNDEPVFLALPLPGSVLGPRERLRLAENPLRCLQLRQALLPTALGHR